MKQNCLSPPPLPPAPCSLPVPPPHPCPNQRPPLFQTYHPPMRRRRRRRRHKTEDGTTSGSALSGGGVNGAGGVEEDGVKRGKSVPSLVTQGLLASSSSNPDKPSYQALDE